MTKVRRDHPDTSHAAAESMLPHEGSQRRRVFDYLLGRYPKGATDEQIQKRLDMNPSSERPRRAELVEDRLVKDSGRRRPTGSGRDAIVWVVTKRGRRQAGE